VSLLNGGSPWKTQILKGAENQTNVMSDKHAEERYTRVSLKSLNCDGEGKQNLTEEIEGEKHRNVA